jgi:hypothetical protein
LSEDESSLWFDHIEEQLAEFQEIKEAYELLQSQSTDEAAEKR